MATHTHIPDISQENRRLGDLAPKIITPAFVVGAIGLVAMIALFFIGDASRAFEAYLVNFLFFTAISLGALFFVLIHHATRAGWSAVVRRIAEGLATNFVLLAILFLPLIYALFSESISIFPWADPALVDATSQDYDSIVAHKSGYLNTTFFLIRAAIYFGIWIFLGRYLFSLSTKQDETGDAELSLRMERISYPGIILFGLSLTFAAIDWIMAQDPHWFSTIFGVYFFAGAVTSFLGLAIVMIAFIQKTGRLKHAITTEHHHDLGKLLFAFGMVFWAYIAYSQYMLIWYANIPEETVWFQPRTSGSGQIIHGSHGDFLPGQWNAWSVFLLVGHFAVPFVCMVSRVPKRRLPLLVIAAVWMLFMCWYDIFWLITPVFHPGTVDPAWSPWQIGLFPLYELAGLLGIGGLYVGLTTMRLRNVALVAEKDPRLPESLAFENF